MVTLITGGTVISADCCPGIAGAGRHGPGSGAPRRGHRLARARGVEVHRGDIRDSETLVAPMRGVELSSTSRNDRVWRPWRSTTQ